MTQTLQIKDKNVKIIFSDIDKEDEMEIVTIKNNKEHVLYLTKKNIISLNKHLSYLIEKMNN